MAGSRLSRKRGLGDGGDGGDGGHGTGFNFEGTPQALDHVLVNTVANSYVQRYAIARGNSDFPDLSAFAEDVARPERSSDHDMPVAYFPFPSPSADLEVTMTASQPALDAGAPVAYTIVVTNNGDSPASNAIVTGTLASELSLMSCTALVMVCVVRRQHRR